MTNYTAQCISLPCWNPRVNGPHITHVSYCSLHFAHMVKTEIHKLCTNINTQNKICSTILWYRVLFICYFSSYLGDQLR